MMEFRSFGCHSRENGNPESKDDELRETAASRDRESTEGPFDTTLGPESLKRHTITTKSRDRPWSGMG